MHALNFSFQSRTHTHIAHSHVWNWLYVESSELPTITNTLVRCVSICIVCNVRDRRNSTQGLYVIIWYTHTRAVRSFFSLIFLKNKPNAVSVCVGICICVTCYMSEHVSVWAWACVVVVTFLFDLNIFAPYRNSDRKLVLWAVRVRAQRINIRIMLH